MGIIVNLLCSENENKSITDKEVTHVTQGGWGDCFVFVGGMVAWFLSMIRQNHELALLCLIYPGLKVTFSEADILFMFNMRIT